MPHHAVCLPLSDANLQRCARALAAGGLVAFPTETVYGLGANALSESALAEVFRAKGRPRTDPLIVHVTSLPMALALADLRPAELARVLALATAHWPGPLTLVVRAVASVPRLATAGGDFVGLRWPAHPVAQALITAAGVPVAAPSANRFGHVSPTRAEHVMADLGAADVLVLDGGPCDVGIESTVVKVDDEAPLAVLRRGAVSLEALAATLRASGLPDAVVAHERHVTGSTAQQAPGQLLTHYAPETPAYVLSTAGATEASREIALCECVVVDFGGRAAALREHARAYFELSLAGDAREAATALFAVLREAERVAGAVAILLPDVRDAGDEYTHAVHDRIYRAASGRFAAVGATGTVLAIAVAARDR